VFVLEEQPHEIFQRAGADLMADLHITLAEALCGLSRVVVKHLDGRGISLNHQKPTGGVLRPGQLLRVEGEGMPIKKSEAKGNLFLRINVDFPEDDFLQDQNVTDRLEELLPKPAPAIKADTVDEVEYSQNAAIDDFGGTDAQGGDAWEDEEEEGAGGTQCAQQ
jgi:DnaJ homolog subfamily A member 2